MPLMFKTFSNNFTEIFKFKARDMKVPGISAAGEKQVDGSLAGRENDSGERFPHWTIIQALYPNHVHLSIPSTFFSG